MCLRRLKPVSELRPSRAILVVDSNLERLAFTATTLGQTGNRVLVATSTERAKSFLNSNVQFDLVVSAVVLKDGGESGVDLAEHIEESGRSTPTLLVSHFSRDLLRFVPGFETQGHFLVNPFTAPELLRRVGSSLVRQQ